MSAIKVEIDYSESETDPKKIKKALDDIAEVYLSAIVGGRYDTSK